MNKNIILGIVIVLLLIGVGYYFSYDREPAMVAPTEMTEMMEKSDNSMINGEESMMDKPNVMQDDDEMQTSGTYEAYSPEKLALAETGDVILFFRASWCPTCRTLDADIKENASAIPEGVTILDVDYDNSNALKQKYGVTYQHTLVQVDSEGNQIAKWTSSPTLASLVTNIK